MVFLIYPLSSAGMAEKARYTDGLIPFFTLTLVVYFFVILIQGEETGFKLLANTWFNVGFALASAVAFFFTAPLWRRSDPGRPSVLDLIFLSHRHISWWATTSWSSRISTTAWVRKPSWTPR
jgi:hypothetical protein